MNRQGNTYTFIYSIVLVVVVAALLAVVALSLQPRQYENIENEKRQNILSSVRISSTALESKKLYDKYIVKQFVVNAKGEEIQGVDAFTVDMASEYQKPAAERMLPIFVADIDGSSKYILPVYGKGLWGPIWGYISLNDDKTTVYGTLFDHKGETPGLGAEITTAEFSGQFQNKTVSENSRITGIQVKKGTNNTGIHEVDGISGGTITSQAVEKMLKSYLKYYEPFLNNKIQ